MSTKAITITSIIFLAIAFLIINRQAEETIRKVIRFLYIAIFSLLVSEISVLALQAIGDNNIMIKTLVIVADLSIIIAFIFSVFLLEQIIGKSVPAGTFITMIFLFTIRILTYISVPMSVEIEEILFNPRSYADMSVQLFHLGAIVPLILSVIFISKGLIFLNRIKKEKIRAIGFISFTSLCMLSKSLADISIAFGFIEIAISLMYIYHLSLILIALLVILTLRRKLLKLIVSPIKILGFLTLTKGGLKICSISFNNEDKLTKATSLVAAFAALSDVISTKRLVNVFRTEKFFEISLVMYFGNSAIGCFLVDRETHTIRELLKGIMMELEEKVRVNEGIVVSKDTEKAEEIARKWLQKFA